MTTSDNNLLPVGADLLVPARSRPQPSGLFSSFWMAGYESACHINRRGQRLDMIAATRRARAIMDQADVERVTALLDDFNASIEPA